MAVGVAPCANAIRAAAIEEGGGDCHDRHAGDDRRHQHRQAHRARWPPVCP